MLCIKVSRMKWRAEVIIWPIKAQKCKSFCSIIEVFQGKIYLEFSLYVTAQLHFMNQHFFTKRLSKDFTQGLRVKITMMKVQEYFKWYTSHNFIGLCNHYKELGLYPKAMINHPDNQICIWKIWSGYSMENLLSEQRWKGRLYMSK